MITVRNSAIKQPKGTILVDFREDLFRNDLNSSLFLYHSNHWEWREMCRLMAEAGYEVLILGYKVPVNVANIKADLAIFAQHNEAFLRNASKIQAERLLVIGPTSYPSAHNARVRTRFQEMRERRGCALQEQRLFDEDIEQTVIALADHIMLYGNPQTLATYPKKLHPRVFLTAPSSAYLGTNEKSVDEIAASLPGFLWFGGGGVGFKGLDLCLELFARRPDLTLHVIGDPREGGFADEYRRELLDTPNIRFHGGMAPSSERFRNVVHQCSFILYPSASEGCSSAVATAMTAGLIPVVSRETGISLPSGLGLILPECSIPALETAVDAMANLKAEERASMAEAAQGLARARYSRDAFSASFRALFHQVLHL